MNRIIAFDLEVGQLVRLDTFYQNDEWSTKVDSTVPNILTLFYKYSRIIQGTIKK